MPVSASQQIDGNYRTITSNEAFLTSSQWTFAALTTGATGAHTVFTVTGDVIVGVFGSCQTNVTGAGTLEVGIAGNTAALVGQVTGTDIDAGMAFNLDGDLGGLVPLSASGEWQFILANGADIIATVGTDTLTAGVVTYYCMWRPLSSTGRVAVTTPA